MKMNNNNVEKSILSKEMDEAVKMIGEGTRREYILQCAKNDVNQSKLNYVELKAVISFMKHSDKTYSEIINCVKGLDKK